MDNPSPWSLRWLSMTILSVANAAARRCLRRGDWASKGKSYSSVEEHADRVQPRLACSPRKERGSSLAMCLSLRNASLHPLLKERALKKPAATLDGLDPAALTASNIKGCSNGDESEGLRLRGSRAREV